MNNFKEKIINLLKKCWKNLCLILVLFLVLDLLAGIFLFFQYCFKTKEKELAGYSPLRINRALIDNFSSELKKREAVFNNVLERQWQNIFQGIAAKPKKID